jgi:hypothetical protein
MLNVGSGDPFIKQGVDFAGEITTPPLTLIIS